MSQVAPLTPEEIELAQRLEARHKAGEPRSHADARKIVARMFADRKADHDRQAELDRQAGREPAGENELPDLMSYVLRVAEKGEVTNPARGTDRALWSWQSQPKGMDREIKHRFLAQACGETRGYQVLEESPAAGQVDGYYLGSRFMADVLTEDYGVPAADLQKTIAQFWPRVSERYAEAAKGQVLVFAAEIGERSVLGAAELKQILGPEGVGRENVDFLVDFPHPPHLPAEMRDLLADPAVRCQIRREDYAMGDDRTPADFAAKLDAIDVPEHLKEAHAAAVATLSGAKSYDEFEVPPAELTEPGLTEPGLTEPGLTEPGLTEPGLTEPGLTEPGLTEPGLTEPEPARTGMTEPTPRQPGAEQPEVQEPAPAQPEPKVPGAEQPAPEAPAPPQPEPRVVVHGQSFVLGADLPRTLTRPTRSGPAVTGMHGWGPPAAEAAPKSPGIEQ
ncbi:hypothetical protein [Streptomyces sp. NBC_00158]|uniref:hypothetical protein n=1 Tax=Streptomyces sp. NBC_00158 TaxID=2903627 RepID=UPI003246F39B